jgi:hypothetical protein
MRRCVIRFGPALTMLVIAAVLLVLTLLPRLAARREEIFKDAA